MIIIIGWINKSVGSSRWSLATSLYSILAAPTVFYRPNKPITLVGSWVFSSFYESFFYIRGFMDQKWRRVEKKTWAEGLSKSYQEKVFNHVLFPQSLSDISVCVCVCLCVCLHVTVLSTVNTAYVCKLYACVWEHVCVTSLCYAEV